MRRHDLSTVVFGASDGLLAALAVVLAVGSKGRGAVLLALFGVLVAEGLGMAVADFLSKERTDVGWRQALAMGGSTGGSIVVVGLPWVFVGGRTAEFASVLCALLLSSFVARMRAERRWVDWAQTFALLAAVATIAGAVGSIK